MNIIDKALVNDHLHICSCLGSGGDEIEIVGNISVDGIEIRWSDANK